MDKAIRKIKLERTPRLILRQRDEFLEQALLEGLGIQDREGRRVDGEGRRRRVEIAEGGFGLVETVGREQGDALSETVDGARHCVLGVVVVVEPADGRAGWAVERLRGQHVLHRSAFVDQRAQEQLPAGSGEQTESVLGGPYMGLGPGEAHVHLC